MGNAVNDAPVIRFVNQILKEALGLSAREIRLSATPKECLVRFGVNGDFADEVRPPVRFASRIFRRLRLMAGLGVYGADNAAKGTIVLELGGDRTVRYNVVDAGDTMVVVVADDVSMTSAATP